MNVEAITQPSDLISQSGAAEGIEGSAGVGDFSTTLRAAIGDEDASRGGRNDADVSADPEADLVEDEGQNLPVVAASSPGEEVLETTTTDELTAESAIAAAHAGEFGGLLPGQQLAARQGAGLSEAEVVEGRPSALDSNPSQAPASRAPLSGEDAPAIETSSRSGAPREGGSQPIAEGPGQVVASPVPQEGRGTGLPADPVKVSSEGPAPSLPESRESAAGIDPSTEQTASAEQPRELGSEAAERIIEGKGERAAEIASASPTSSVTTASRPDDTVLQAAEDAAQEEESQGDRQGSNASRDFSEAEEQSVAEQRPSLADEEAQAGVSAEAAAAYATASGNVRPDEAISLEGGVAVAGPVAVNGPETASAPTAPTSNAPQPAAASDAIAVQTEWLATRGGGSARLRLHPAELGEIEIRVSLRGGVVDVVMVAQEAVTQALAEEQSERLSQAFANRDLRMESFEVRRGEADGTSNQANEDLAQSRQQDQERNERNDQVSGGRERRAVGQVGGEAAPSTPVMPQIIATGPEASVDLRI